MESDMEDFMYDDLPEMLDLTPASNNADSASSSNSSANVSSFPSPPSSSSSFITERTPLLSLTVGKNIKDDTHILTSNLTKTSSKKCVCRGNIQWTWDHLNKSDNVEILNDDMEVRFNKKYSNGTAVVRCTEAMSNDQYYWEVKMNYPVYGTDVMIGVGTSEATIAYLPDRYVSRLGMDEQTWGFSRHGLFHHNGERRCYAQKFDQGNVIGVHLDLWKGTLSFYKDRKHLGIACSGLKDKTLYAMASSTAACSGMRIVHACCFPSSLQFLCAAKLREIIPDDKNVLDVVNVPPGLKQFLQNNLSWLLDKSDLEEDFKTCCMKSNTASNVDDLDTKPTASMFLLMSSFIARSIFNEEPARGAGTVNRENSSERNPKRSRTSN